MPTRKEATLDLILTNMHEYYSSPQVYSPFGLSDHNVVVATPMDGKRNISSKKVTMRRDLRTNNKAALGRYLTQINWPLLFTPLVSCEEKWQVFQDVIHSGLDTIMPVKPVKLHGRRPVGEREFEISYYEGHMAVTQLTLNTFVTLSTERGKPAEGNTRSQRSST